VPRFSPVPAATWVLARTDASTGTRPFFSWFGPRGLATALFALLVADQLDPVLAAKVLHLAVNAVWISAILHGLTAAPGAKWYADRIRHLRQGGETEAVESSSDAFRARTNRSREIRE